MSKPNIALDMDSTLAETMTVSFKLLGVENKYNVNDVSSWEWGKEKFGEVRFLSSIWHAWTIRQDDIQPVENDIAEKVEELRKIGNVDIVTHHPDHLGISSSKKKWLDNNGIEYRDFVPVNGDNKEELGYDVYIDDNPNLPERVNKTNPNSDVFLYSRAHNQKAPGEYTRIKSVSEVIENMAQKA